MKKDIIINSTTAETRVALLEDDQMVELFVERPRHERNVGSIYKGKVKKLVPGVQAAFVDIGWEQDAFLHFSEVGIDFLGTDDEEDHEIRSKSRDRKVNLQVGQEILVQIVKEQLGLSISTGFASFPDEALTFDDLLNQAENQSDAIQVEGRAEDVDQVAEVVEN